LITKRYPATFACFLVGGGIWHYKEGDYWSFTNTYLEYPLDLRQQEAAGRFFLRFLRARKLAMIELPGANPFVTPILLHGGIPQRLLTTFFTQVVRFFLNQSLTNVEEIKPWLRWYRREAKQISMMRRQLALLQEEQDNLTLITEQLDCKLRAKILTQLLKLPERMRETHKNILREAFFDCKRLLNQYKTFLVLQGSAIMLDNMLADSQNYMSIEQAAVGQESLRDRLSVTQKYIDNVHYYLSAIEQGRKHFQQLRYLLTDLIEDLSMAETLSSSASESETPPAIYLMLQEMAAAVEPFRQLSLTELWEQLLQHTVPSGDLVQLWGQRQQITCKTNKLQQTYSKKAAELDGFRLPFSYLDEPILRFLVYGDTWTLQWLDKMLQVLLSDDLSHLGTSSPPEVEESLPTRVVDELIKWKQQGLRDAEEVRTRDVTQRLNKPRIQLLPDSGTLSLQFPAQQIGCSEVLESPCLIWEVCDSDSGTIKERQNIALNGYRVSNKAIRTEECGFPLTTFLDKHRLILLVDNKPYRVWELVLPVTEIGYASFDEQGCLIEDSYLAYPASWLILRPDYRLGNQVHIQTRDGLWADNQYLELLFISTEELFSVEISVPGKIAYQIPVARPRLNPYLSGGETAPGIRSEGNPVYLKKVPTLTFPWNVLDDPEFLQCSLIVQDNHSGQKRKRRLQTLRHLFRQDHQGNSCLKLDVPEILGEEPVGSYTLQIFYGRQCRYEEHLNIVPALWVLFGQEDLYFPLAPGEDEIIQFQVITPRGLSFRVLPPATATAVAMDQWSISISRSASMVQGQLQWTEQAKDNTLPITIELPQITWRLHKGTALEPWSICTSELWLRDLEQHDKLLLEVHVPENVPYSRATLYCEGAGLAISMPKQGTTFSSDLVNYLDTLRQGNVDAYIFELRVYTPNGSKAKQGPLFAIQVAWQVINLSSNGFVKDNKTSLYLAWNERGKVETKIIGLWRKWKPWQPPWQRQIAAGITEWRGHDTSELLPPGSYLAHLTELNPWASSLPLPPTESNFTTHINIRSDYPQIDYQGSSWKQAHRLLVQGKTTACQPGTQIRAIVLGCTNGLLLMKSGHGIIDKDGYFEITICDQRLNTPGGQLMKRWAHWLCLVLDEHPDIYQIVLLPDPALLGLPLSVYRTNVHPEDIKISGLPQELQAELQSYNIQARILEAWKDNKDMFGEYNLGSSHRQIRIRWYNSKNRGSFQVEKGVRCASCGVVLPSQQDWFDHSSRLVSPNCKRMETTYSQERAFDLLAVWNIKPVLNELKLKYPWADWNKVQLFGSANDPIHYTFSGSIPPGLTPQEFLNTMWEKEQELAVAAQQGG